MTDGKDEKAPERAEDGRVSKLGDGEPNLSSVAAGRMEATGKPPAPLSPGSANSSHSSKARRKDAT